MSVPEPGLEILPGLTLLRPLGRGGMGEAWLARDAERGEDVVAKVLPGDAAPERVALLRREARLLRKLKHPRIVPVYGFRGGERASAVTLRHMRGGDASRRRGAPPHEVVRLGREVAEALEYLHGLGVVHRDVKPSNVLLDEEGHAHLADFGIAAVLSGDEDGVVLQGGGSRASMSPQQRAGGAAEPADDLYALGALLFELLSGRPPFPPETTDQEILARDPPPVASPFPVPASLRALVAALLERSPEARPPSATAVKEALETIGSQLDRSPAAPARPPVPLQPPPRVDEGGASAHPLENRLDRTRSRPRVGLSPGQATLLAGLAVVALAAVVWLPRWAQAPAGPSPTPAPTTSATPVPPVAPASPSLTPPPAEAAPDPPAAEAAAIASPSPPRPAPAARVPPPSTAPSASSPPVAPAPAPLPTPDRQAEAQALARHRESGRALEESENWPGALAEYEAALAVDPHVAFAVEGKERVAARAALADRLAFHVSNPQRLSTEAVAREAESLLERARDVEPQGPRHRAQVAALENALGEARTPIPVVLESDGLTDVVLSRLGRLGTLTRRTVELRPGTYTLVGSRRGYRDVRRQFTVTSGAPALVVSVRCEEAF